MLLPKPARTPPKARQALPRNRTPIARHVRPAQRSARRGAVDKASERWTDLVRERDAWECQRCGLSYEWLKDHHDTLDGHHIRGKKAHPELRFVVENGIALCRQPDGGCHGWAHDHPVLFRLWLLQVRPSAARLWEAAA